MRAGFLEALQQPGEGRQRIVIAAELRPPRAELDTHAGMGAWIDTYHAVRALTRRDTFVCLTDSAVGRRRKTTSGTSSPTSVRMSIDRASCRS